MSVHEYLLGTKKWKRLRRMVLASEPLCRRCRAEGRMRLAIDLHHQIPRANLRDVVDALDQRYLEPLCKSCHSRETSRERRAKFAAKREDAYAKSALDWCEKGQGGSIF